MAMQTEVKTQAPPLQSEDTTVSPADVVKIELTLGHSFIGKRQIQFQWDCNVAITTGEFELVRLQPYELFYKGSQFSCTVEYTSKFLSTQSSYKIILREEGVLAESPIILIDIPPEVPNQPSPPKFQLSSKTTAYVRWNAVENNGANIIAYHLECLMPGTTTYKLVYSGIERNIKLPIKFQSDSEYGFRLRAVNSVGNSPYSSVLKYLTSPGRPTAPSPPQFHSHTSNSITVGWDEINTDTQQGDTIYILELETPSSGHGFLVVYHDKDSVYKKEGLTRTCQYKFRLAIHNQFGTSPYSQIVTYSTAPEPPSKPETVVLCSKPEHRSLHVSWDSPVDDGGVKVIKYVIEVTGFARQLKKPYILESVDSEVRICDLRPGQEYRVRVAAENTAGIGRYSSSEIFRTKVIKPECPRLEDSQVVLADINYLKLQWGYPGYDGGGKICGCQVEMKKAGEWVAIYQDRRMSCRVDNLQPLTSYTFRVRCENEAGYSPFTNQFEGTTIGGEPLQPSPPNLICPLKLLISANWTPPQLQGVPITGYILQMKTMSTSVKWKTCYEGMNVSCDIKQNICADTKYQFRLSADTSLGTSPWSEVAFIRTCAGPPGMVQNVKINKIKQTSVMVEWNAIELVEYPVTSYCIYLNHSLHKEISHEMTSFSITTLHPASRYDIQLQATNNIGSGPLSSIISFQTPPSPPDPPTLELDLLTSNSAVVKWVPTSQHSDKYLLQLASQNTKFQTVYSGADKKFKLLRLKPRNSYTIRISAVNVSGEGKPSENISFYTLPQPPPITRDVVTQWVNEKLLISWRQQDTDVYLYQLQLREPGDEFRSIYEGKNCKCIIRCELITFEVRVITKLNLTEKLDTRWPDFIESSSSEIVTVNRPKQGLEKSVKKTEKYSERRFKMKELTVETVPVLDEPDKGGNSLSSLLNSPYTWMGLLIVLTLILSIIVPFYVKFD